MAAAADAPRILAVDFGGTKMAVALVTPDGDIVRQQQTPTTPTDAGEGEQLWANLDQLIDEVCGTDTPTAVGVGCGGPMVWPDGFVSPLNVPAWREFPLRDRLRSRFPDVPVRVANDAVAMAVGEHWKGAGQDAQSFLGIVVSTGVGGGLVLDGAARHGATGNAGHIGHVVVEPDGPICGCGARGCLEAVARGPVVVRWAVEQGWRSPSSAPPDGRALLASASTGNDIAVAAFSRAGAAVGLAVASATNLLELDLVAVGGGLANAGDLLLGPAQAAFERHARLAFAARCRIVTAALGGAAGLVGAAALVACGDRYWPAGAD
jgi:glucokinase